jgi:hypothetical protein
VTERRIGAGIWFLIAFVMAATGLNELLEGDAASAVIGATLAAASAWVGYRVLRNLSRDSAVVGACLAAVFALLTVASMVQGNLAPFPSAAIVLALVAAAGIIPMRLRPPVD